MLKGIVNGTEKDITRIPMLVGSEYKEGWEVRDNQDRILWGADKTFTGTDSIAFKGYGLPISSWEIQANMVQNGTPTPASPIVPVEFGDRTANICPYAAAETKTNNGITAVSDGRGTYHVSGTATSDSVIDFNVPQFFIPKSLYAGGSGTFSMFNNKTYPNANVKLEFLYQGRLVDNWGLVGLNRTNISYSAMSGKDCDAIGFTVKSGVTVDFTISPELTDDGTLPAEYEPFGYKIPSSLGTIYLPEPLRKIGDYADSVSSDGTVTRRVRKLVLTGEESWYRNDAVSRENTSYYYTTKITDGLGEYAAVSTHFTYDASSYSDDIEGFSVFSGYGSLRIRISNAIAVTTTNFKVYLAAQYAAGTPVTVWYILAEPTTESITVPEFPTATGLNTLTIDTTLAPSKTEIKVHAKPVRYGFKIDKTNDNSDTAVVYTHDSVTMTPAAMNYTTGEFNYGSWENAWFVRDCYPVALNLNGTETYRLDPDDYTKKIDGTASDIQFQLLTEEPADWSTQWKQYYTKDSSGNYELNSQSTAPTFTQDTYYKLTYGSFTGNFMMAFPKVWFKRYEDATYNYVEIASAKLSDDFKAYAHINASGQEVDHIYLPLFEGVILDSKLRSVPGVIPQGSTTATTEVNAATALGSRWQIWDHSSVECINDLLILMSKSIDSQTKFGRGRESGYNADDTVTYGKLQTGTLIKSGKFKGFSSSTKEVKVFGIEGFWANRWDRLQGMLFVDNVWKIKMTPPYNFTGTDFATLSDASVPTGNGYLSAVQTSEYGSIPASINGGSSAKFYKDYFYKTATGTRVAVRGGNCSDGGYCGFRCVNVYNAASRSVWHIGASPVYK